LKKILLRSSARSEMVDITRKVQEEISRAGMREGVCYLFVPHTTAGITVNEGADPSVRRDILRKLDSLVPWEEDYSHGEGNAAAHIRASLVGTSLILLVREGTVALGTWQSIFFCEFDGPRQREVWIAMSGLPLPALDSDRAQK
jgi:secondary thiamine-phosphate synthase enzyme